MYVDHGITPIKNKSPPIYVISLLMTLSSGPDSRPITGEYRRRGSGGVREEDDLDPGQRHNTRSKERRQRRQRNQQKSQQSKKKMRPLPEPVILPTLNFPQV